MQFILDKGGEVWGVDCSVNYTVNGVNLGLGDNFENCHKIFYEHMTLQNNTMNRNFGYLIIL